jgi:hypothetical protein
VPIHIFAHKSSNVRLHKAATHCADVIGINLTGAQHVAVAEEHPHASIEPGVGRSYRPRVMRGRSCGRTEALTGECAGRPLCHEKADIPGADAVRHAEGHMKGRYQGRPVMSPMRADRDIAW